MDENVEEPLQRFTGIILFIICDRVTVHPRVSLYFDLRTVINDLRF